MLAVFTTLVATVAGGVDPASVSTPAAVAGTAQKRPNIVLISTDDMADYDLRYMPHTRRLIGRQGATLRGFISPHPLCCPARAEILTGQYAQNNGVRHNKGPFGGYPALDPQHTIGTWLHDSGYQTGFVGKFLNGYERTLEPNPGWDIFSPLVRRVYRAYGTGLLEDGYIRRYDDIHSADLVGMKTRQYIKRFSAADKPFFIWASQVAPHQTKGKRGTWVPPVPARRHRSLFSDVQAPSVSDPAFNERNVSDKPWYIRHSKRRSVADANHLFRRRIRSLQAVDEAVRSTVRTLKETGELRNTVIAFTSDNGFLIGEHRFYGKNTPYEQALQVPLLVRGPGIPVGVTRKQTTSMIDLAPTFLQLAHARPDLPVDGRSLLPVIRRNRGGYRTSLIQAGDAVTPWLFRGVRTKRYTYVGYFRGFEELYDRRQDPHQLLNVAHKYKYQEVLLELRKRTAFLSNCSGDSCRREFVGGLDLTLPDL